MGFMLKKMLSAMIMPLSIAIILMGIAAWFIWKGRVARIRLFFAAGFGWLLLMSYAPVSYALIHPLESAYEKLETMPENAQYVLLLGGGMEERGWEALRLYHQREGIKIITSGYEGSRKIADAVRTANMFMELGVPAEAIIIHDTPRDTKEEAIKIKEVLGNQPFVLVTSGYHMPRSMGLFQKEGLNPVAAPTDIKREDGYSFLSFFSVDDLKYSTIAFHEYIGLLWGWLRGQL